MFSDQKQSFILVMSFWSFYPLSSDKIFAVRDGRPTEIISALRFSHYLLGNIYKEAFFFPVNTGSSHLLFCTNCSFETSTKPGIFNCQTFLSLLFVLFLPSFFTSLDSNFVFVNCLLTLYLILLFFGCACSMQKSLGWGLDLHHSSNLNCCSDKARSLTHCVIRELLLAHFYTELFQIDVLLNALHCASIYD